MDVGYVKSSMAQLIVS